MMTVIDGTLGITTAAATISGALSAATETFTATPAVTTAQSMVRLAGQNGHGSTNTAIARFAAAITNQGSDITYADSATLGASFTINTAGVYSMSWSAPSVAGTWLGITLNSASPASGVTSATSTELLALTYNTTAGGAPNVSWTGYLPAGSVLRAHDMGGAISGSPGTQLTIVRVA